METLRDFGHTFSKSLANPALSVSKRSYLKRVYSLLASCLVVCFAAHLFVLRHPQIGAALSVWALPLLLTSSCYLVCCSDRTAVAQSSNLRRRQIALFLICLCTGVLLSQIVRTVSKFHPEIVRSALATTAVVFTGFTIASFYATTSTLLGVYSMINSLSLYMIAAWFSSFFTYRIVSNHVTMLASVFLESLYLYKFSLEIVLRPEVLDKDPLYDSYILFSNLVNLFLTILREMLNKNAREDDEDRNRSRKNQ